VTIEKIGHNTLSRLEVIAKGKFTIQQPCPTFNHDFRRSASFVFARRGILEDTGEELKSKSNKSPYILPSAQGII
jgi:hypothetical protein